MRAGGRGVLLDIEGTTSSIRFVYDVLFPAARGGLESFLRENWGRQNLQRACDTLARDAGHDALSDWCGSQPAEVQRQLVQREALRLMDQDAKTTGLKQLQGLVWQRGFETGALRAHVYDDVPPALVSWQAAGVDVRIYSSGSIAAQKLFFGHTIHGDLLAHFRGFYDTTTGPKRAASSYVRIAEDIGLAAAGILFLSDVPPELDAARAAGLQTGLCLRPGNQPVAAGHGHLELTDFSQVALG